MKLAIVFFCISYSSLSYAGQWSASAILKQDLAYDDNVRMSATNPQGSMEYKLIPTAKFTYATEQFNAEADASYGIQRYPNITGYDRSLQNYAFKSNYATQRSLWGVSANLNIAPSRNTAIQDSGNFSSNSERTSQSVTPFVSYRVTELDSLKLSANYSETRYSTSDFSNSTTQNLELSWQRQWSERCSNSLSSSYSHFKFGGQSISDSYNINLSLNYLWSEKLTLSGTVGGRLTRSENTFSQTSTLSNGFLFNAAINYKAENLTSALEVSRSIMPSSLGQLQQQNGLNLNASYQMTERLSAELTASYQQMTLLNNSNPSSRENITVQPSLNWKISTDWSLSGSYRYRNQSVNSNAQNTTADSNLLMVSINYNWQGLNFSR